MPESTTNPLEYYSCQSSITDPREYASLFNGLPSEISVLCRIVQGVLIHIFHTHRYGVELSEERKQEVNLRHIAKMLARIRELNDRALTAARPPEKRLVGNCRDFSTMLCAILRHQGVPARARCGFARYFMPGKYEDHWVCEYWKVDEHRWVMVDAQLDEIQRKALQIEFDPCDVPHDQFLLAGKAWQLCRAGQADPDRFGILDMHGLWFIRGNVVRDLASLNKMELLPWDCWGLIDKKKDENLSPEDMSLLDLVATLTLAGNEAFHELHTTYEDARLRVPSVTKSYTSSGVRTVRVKENSSF